MCVLFAVLRVFLVCVFYMCISRLPLVVDVCVMLLLLRVIVVVVGVVCVVCVCFV